MIRAVMNNKEIELAARELQARIWRERTSLFPMGVPKPIDMLEPEVAARALGVQFGYAESLGNWGPSHEIAGLLDQQRGVILVSLKFDYSVMRFTGAHEAGHLALGHRGKVIHRDRPIFDIHPSGDLHPDEREANYFAACFLAPERLVIEEYLARFRIGPPLPLTDAVAFNLCGVSEHALMRAGPGSMRFATAVAGARSFNGRHFRSLAEHFKLSVSAMAYRLRELGLLEG
jgi:Zn-dependent peptidase ImmA (M78 family)